MKTTTTMPTTTTTIAPARRVSAAKPRARATRSTTVARATVDRGDDADRPSGVDAAARALGAAACGATLAMSVMVGGVDAANAGEIEILATPAPVSYTHLTLPTILLV